MIPPDPGFVGFRTAFGANDHYYLPTYLPLMGGPLGTSLVACGMIADTRQGKNDEGEIEGGYERGWDDADPNWKKRAREET
jgi:hypothetical protein